MSAPRESSPSESYARYRRNREHPMLADFASRTEFQLDDFQLRACRELEEGRSVLVAAPTGSGKTIVGEFAVHLALQTGRKAFYTTPIKALSNQKFHDLAKRYGSENVGLLTGDNSINGEAPVVVMTTEVLRNMLYAGSRTLETLGFVVMDEVHYLADRMRGAVWEEVIIHLPESVAVASLSATVSNAEEFGEWLGTVRGETTTIVEERRPVPLYQHVVVGRRMFDLFADEEGTDPAELEQRDHEPKVNPELQRVARDDWARGRIKDRRPARGGKRPLKGPGGTRGVWTPTRAEVVEQLDRAGLLPAIVFIFSRVGCDAAVQQCLNANLRLTSPAERDEIYAFVSERCSDLPEEDLQVLGYHEFLDGLTRGIAAHHAGMLPKFKECVEELFLRGPVPGRVRDRDARPGHQHAGPLGRHREALQVERRDPRRHHAGGVHPADRSCRPPRHRRRGSRCRAVAAGAGPQGGRRPRLDAHLPPQVELPAVVQHGGQPGPPVRPRARPRAAGVVLRAVPGRQGRRRARPPAAQERGRPDGVLRRRRLPPRRLHGVRRPPPAPLRHREEPRQVAHGSRAARRSWTPWRRCAPAT